MRLKTLVRGALASAAILGTWASSASAQVPTVDVPRAVAPGGRFAVFVHGLVAPVRVELFRGGSWRPAGKPVAQDGGSADVRASGKPGSLKVRARGADGVLAPERRIRVRALLLAAVGDINLGDGPGDMINRFGARYPWVSVGRG